MAIPQKFNIYGEGPGKPRVWLTAYPAQGKDHIGCVICPGGSYFWLANKTEGHRVAQKLQRVGISAFVLQYRVAGIPAFISHYRWKSLGHKYPEMLYDALQALRFVREKAEEFHINKAKVGIMGFSAGGHLALLAAENASSEVVSPKFVASIYPVVSLTESCAHQRSCRGLLGDQLRKRPELRLSLSAEKRVTETMPPVFLVHCQDDPTVDYHNSELLHRALQKHGIPHKYLLYRSGGHGFGTTPEKTSQEAIHWVEEFERWVKDLF